MKLSKLTLAVVAALGASVSSAAFAIDFYVDTKTKQIFAEPGKNRVKMGAFTEVKGSNAAGSDNAALEEVKQDLELKDNAIKALEEKITAVNDDKKKDKEAWYNKINIGGYTQMRYNVGLGGDRKPTPNQPALASTGDGSIGNDTGFFLRRARIKFSGDISDYVSLYMQIDFATALPNPIGGGTFTGTSSQHFGQLRDAYADIFFDKGHEYRIRAGISKVPFGWENMQSSQNRIAMDRNDALNSATLDERDLGLVAYWTPTDVQKLWKKLSKNGLKTSGDYGILGAGVYNGQGLNRAERNDDMYVVVHSTYPVELGFMGDFFDGQVLEVGADALSGKFTPTLAAYTKPTGGAAITPTVKGDNVVGPNGAKISEDRVGVHAILFPQPFGVQAEWNWGKGGALNPTAGTIERRALHGGYVQAMYKFDKVFGTEGTIIPYVKWQTYKGQWKKDTNMPYISTSEYEAGVEYQIMKALELTVAYSDMNRTNDSSMYQQANGSLLRMQLQFNY
jgi:hypothetical protein